MKKIYKWILMLIFGSIALQSGILLASDIDVQSKIARVVVFQDRALVTRVTGIKLVPGRQSMHFKDLPGAIEEDSVSAKGKGEARVILYGVQFVRRESAQSQSPRILELQNELKAWTDKQIDFENQKKALESKQNFLESIKAASSDQIGKELITKQPSIHDAAEVGDYIEKELLNIFQKSHKLDIELRTVKEEIDRINREISQHEGDLQYQKSEIIVELEAQNAGSFILELSYRLPGATWVPIYEARALSNQPEIEFNSYALVRQRTGENWDNVPIELSTAKPSVGGRFPDVEPWFLKKREPPVLYEERFGQEALRMESSLRRTEKQSLLAEQSQQSMQRPASIAQATTQAEGTAVLFKLPKPETILSDWQPQKVMIANHQFSGLFSYQIIPRLSTYAYLTAKIKNNFENFLLPGQVQIFSDGAFVGNSSIDLLGSGEEFKLSFGIDERIKVDRKQLQAKADQSILPGFHGRMKTIDYQYLTKIENYGSADADIIVIDQIPISQHDEIRIENIKIEPAQTEEDNEKPGVMRWIFKLGAKAKKEIKISYRVKHPADFEVLDL